MVLEVIIILTDNIFSDRGKDRSPSFYVFSKWIYAEISAEMLDTFNCGYSMLVSYLQRATSAVGILGLISTSSIFMEEGVWAACVGQAACLNSPRPQTCHYSQVFPWLRGRNYSHLNIFVYVWKLLTFLECDAVRNKFFLLNWSSSFYDQGTPPLYKQWDWRGMV